MTAAFKSRLDYASTRLVQMSAPSLSTADIGAYKPVVPPIKPATCTLADAAAHNAVNRLRGYGFAAIVERHV